MLLPNYKFEKAAGAGGATATHTGEALWLLSTDRSVTVINRVVTVEIAWQGFQGLPVENAVRDCSTGLYESDDAYLQLLHLTSCITERCQMQSLYDYLRGAKGTTCAR